MTAAAEAASSVTATQHTAPLWETQVLPTPCAVGRPVSGSIVVFGTDRQAVRVRRLLARVGIITVAATRCSPRRAVVVAVFAPERRGGTNEIAVSDTAVHANRSAGRALQRRRATAMTMPTTEMTPVTTANSDNGIVSAPSGLEVDANGLRQRSGEGGGHRRRCE